MHEYMPLENGEVTDLQFVHSLYRIMKDAQSLKPRLTMIGKWWRWRGIVKQLQKIFEEVWLTIEPEKRRRIDVIWSQQELRIVNANQAVDPTGDMVMIPTDSIRMMARMCQDEKCAICMGGHNDRKDCPFRKSMQLMALPDLRKLEKQTGKCMGKIFDWGA